MNSPFGGEEKNPFVYLQFSTYYEALKKKPINCITLSRVCAGNTTMMAKSTYNLLKNCFEKIV